MKKVLCLLLAGCLLFSLTACGSPVEYDDYDYTPPTTTKVPVLDDYRASFDEIVEGIKKNYPSVNFVQVPDSISMTDTGSLDGWKYAIDRFDSIIMFFHRKSSTQKEAGYQVTYNPDALFNQVSVTYTFATASEMTLEEIVDDALLYFKDFPTTLVSSEMLVENYHLKRTVDYSYQNPLYKYEETISGYKFSIYENVNQYTVEIEKV